MNCPICKTPTLQAMTLPTGPAGPAGGGLSARQCATCAGHWVEGEVYLLWVEKHRSDADAAASDASPLTTETPVPADSTRAKLCPHCGRLLTRAKVGRGLSVHIDRCGTCAGFWFDAGEWDALLARRLHTEAHQVFSDAWQFEVQREERRLQHERLMIARVGEADWREIQRIKTWIEAHPRRVELFAVLTEGREELTNRTGKTLRRRRRLTRTPTRLFPPTRFTFPPLPLPSAPWPSCSKPIPSPSPSAPARSSAASASASTTSSTSA